jgi:peptide/nickel transport system substrate-binding protein
MRKFTLMLAILMCLLVVACSNPADTTGTRAANSTTGIVQPTSQPQYGGRLRIMIKAGPGSPIGWPAEAVGPALVYTKPCLESLLFEDTNGNIKPWLATGWEIAPDQKSVTLTLRKGVKFHDGTDFNAQAAKWNLEEAIKSKKSGTSVWKSIDVIDDYTIKINISEFQNTILSDLTLSSALMISPTAYETKGVEWVRWNPVGTGSFKFNSYQRDVSLKWDRFDDYWQKGKPYLDGIDYVIVADSMAQMAAFQAGEADVLSIGDPQSASELKAKGYQIIYSHTNTVCLIPDSANTDSPLAKKEVREAIDYAIDKAGIVNALGYGFYIAKYQLPVPSQSVFLTDIKERKYDVAKAKQLLSEAGYPSGFAMTIIPDPQSANADVVTAIQSALSAIGINVAVENVPVSKFTEYRTKGWKNGVICMALGVSTPNFAQGLNGIFSSTLFPSMKKTPEYVTALNSALLATDPAKKTSYTEQAVRAVSDDEMVIPIYSGISCYALQKNVHDTGFLTIGHFTIWAYYDAWLEK